MQITHTQGFEHFPLKFRLEQNYPNPSLGITTINYCLPNRTKVRIVLTDCNGKIIYKLVAEEQEAGMYSVELNTVNLPTGTYCYQLIAGNHYETKKMVVISEKNTQSIIIS